MVGMWLFGFLQEGSTDEFLQRVILEELKQSCHTVWKQESDK